MQDVLAWQLTFQTVAEIGDHSDKCAQWHVTTVTAEHNRTNEI